MMDTTDKTRLEKLLGMLGSSFEGERANAGRMIAEMAERADVTVVELIYGREPAFRQPAPARRQPTTPNTTWSPTLQALAEIAEYPGRYADVLTAWELEFAADITRGYKREYELSTKQRAIVDKILAKVGE